MAPTLKLDTGRIAPRRGRRGKTGSGSGADDASDTTAGPGLPKRRVSPVQMENTSAKEHFAVFKGKDGAGAIDVLMLPDPATGELLPETEHTELAAHVRAQMQVWTCDKVYGLPTFPLTQNAAEVMYNCWFDRRVNRRARVKSRTKP